LRITDINQAFFAKMFGCGLQEGRLRKVGTGNKKDLRSKPLIYKKSGLNTPPVRVGMKALVPKAQKMNHSLGLSPGFQVC
jgi:hypothetical protein